MSWGGFWAIFERAAFLQHCEAADTWVGNEVRRASGGAGGRRLLEALDAWVGDKVRQASSGADCRRLLNDCELETQCRFAKVSDSVVAACFTSACMHRCRVHLFAGGILCVDSWYALFSEVVRECGYSCRDQHASVHTFCVCFAAEGVLAAKKMACIDSRHFLCTCTCAYTHTHIHA